MVLYFVFLLPIDFDTEISILQLYTCRSVRHGSVADGFGDRESKNVTGFDLRSQRWEIWLLVLLAVVLPGQLAPS